MKALTQMTISLRLPLSPEERQRLDVMDKRQREWLMDEPRRLREAEEEEMGGRVSGPEEWRKARDEMGDQVGEGVIMPQYTGKFAYADRVLVTSQLGLPHGQNRDID